LVGPILSANNILAKTSRQYSLTMRYISESALVSPDTPDGVENELPARFIRGLFFDVWASWGLPGLAKAQTTIYD